MRKLFLLCILLSSCVSKLEDDLPLSLIADSSAFIVLDFKKANYNGYVFNKNKRKYLIYGLPYVEEERTFNLGEYKIKVEPKFFGESRIEIADTNLVTPKLSDQQRASAEYLRVKKIVSGTSRQFDNDFNFIAPVDNVITSKFGKRRFINNNPRSPHMALDIRGAVGNEVVAPKTGKVLMAEQHFYGGKKLFLIMEEVFLQLTLI